MIWLVGRGMLGKQIERALKVAGKDFCATDIEVDITDIAEVRNFVSGKKIDWIINCAAYTAVDQAESDEDRAYQINAIGVRNLARVCEEIKAKIIHFSTDYVFSGFQSFPINEDERPEPRSAYGRTKLAGEELLQKETQSFFLIRISWLYGVYGKNFVKTMIRLMKEKESIRVVGDQLGCPTYAKTLAENITRLIQKDSCSFGIFHYSDKGEISWYDFALAIQKLGKKSSILSKEIPVNKISTAEYPTPAERPRYSVFDQSRVKSTLNFEVRNWQENLEIYFEEWKDHHFE